MRALKSFLLRELRAALLNRFIHVFSLAALAAGALPLFADTGSEVAETAPYFLMQGILYLVPLFALLIGVGSAQAEIEEQPFLLTQPAGRGVRVLGKLLALWGVIAGALLLMALPPALHGGPVSLLLVLWLHGAGAAGVFLAFGLATGFTTGDRVKAHLAALCLWFVFLAGFNFVALFGAQTMAMQDLPQVWVGFLMLNPLDALRISALLTLDRVPFEVLSLPPLAAWWIENLRLWFAIISALWLFAALAWSRHRLEKNED